MSVLDYKISNKIVAELNSERINQILKFGHQSHDPFKYASILTEECGEVSKAVNDAYFWKSNEFQKDLSDLREELIQVAAVAIAFIECLDTNEWRS